MNLTEYKAFKQAVAIALTGQKEMAYRQFKALHASGPENVDLLLWTAFTSPDIDESTLFIASAALLEPSSPAVVEAQRWLATKKELGTGTLRTASVS
jgi:hypothetical protein